MSGREALLDLTSHIFSGTLGVAAATLDATRRTIDVTTNTVSEVTSKIKSKVDDVRSRLEKEKQIVSRETIRSRLRKPSSEWEISNEEEVLVLERNFLSLLETCESRMRGENNEDEQTFDWCPKSLTISEVPMSALVLYIQNIFEELKERGNRTKLNLNPVDFEKQIKRLAKFVEGSESDFSALQRKVRIASETQSLADSPEKKTEDIVKSGSSRTPESTGKQKKYVRFSQKNSRRRRGVETQGGNKLLKQSKMQQEELEDQLHGLTDDFLRKQREISRTLQEDKKKWAEISEQTDENLEAVQIVTKKTEDFTSKACSQQCWLWFGMMCVAITWVVSYFVIRFFRIESRFF